MTAKIAENLYIGDGRSCFYENRDGWGVIHACKHPCHQKIVGYRGNLSSQHPNYLIMESESHLALNMVDMEIPLSAKFTNPIFFKAIEFIQANIKDRKILVHCNVGISRSPAIALVYLAKVQKTISDSSYEEAKVDFLKLYPTYQPGRGINAYLGQNWKDLMQG